MAKQQLWRESKGDTRKGYLDLFLKLGFLFRNTFLIVDTFLCRLVILGPERK